MELGWMTTTDGQRPQATQEQPSVHMELLPLWKQQVMESRQVQTVSQLLTAQLKRQRLVVEQQVIKSRQQRYLLADRWPSLLS